MEHASCTVYYPDQQIHINAEKNNNNNKSIATVRNFAVTRHRTYTK